MARKKASPLTAAAKAMGRKGGKAGGPARDRTLTKAQKSEIGRKGGKASGEARKKNG